MDRLAMIKQASCAGRAEFERRVQETGLTGTPIRGGYMFIKHDNPGIDVEAVLEAGELDPQPHAIGVSWIANEWPFVRSAICQAQEDLPATPVAP